MSHDGIALELAKFATSLRLGDLPDDVVEKARVHLLDQVGAQVAGASEPWNAIVREYALDESPPGPCVVVGTKRRTTAEWAAFANASAGQGLEIDDYHTAAMFHPGAVTVPAGIAVAEARGRTGADLLAAVAIGFEVGLRISASSQPGMNLDRGIHPTSAVGPFAATMVSGLLAGLSAPQLAHALGIAGSHSGGTVEYSQSGGEVKRLHAGLACAAGIRSVALAQRGLTGPSRVLEGRKGVLQAMSADPRTGEITAGLGEHWLALDTAIKLHASNGFIQAPIEALRRILAEHRLDETAVGRIDVGLNRAARAITAGNTAAPAEMIDLQFSLAYSLAIRLVLGSNDVAAYKEYFSSDTVAQRVRDVARRVHVVVDQECDDLFPQAFLAKVTLGTTQGATLSERSFAPGTPENPISTAAVREKFERLIESSSASHRGAELLAAIDHLEGLPDVSGLTALLN